MPCIVFTGGGSIGHIAPAVAVARQLKGTDVHFICSTKNDDRQFLRKEGFTDITQINAPRPGIAFPWKFWKAYRKARHILEEKKPRVVFSKGGYVSVPVCFAAHLLSIPIVLHESDVVSGYANRIVARWANHICLGFPKETMNKSRETYTGNPIRPGMNSGSAEEGIRLAGLEGRNKPIVLAIGGSQGAAALNAFIVHHLHNILRTFDIIHITGKGKHGFRHPHEGYWSTEFADEELCHLYAATDIAVSRAGMNVIGELAANAIPSILIPLRKVAHDHQQKNAVMIRNAGGCLIVQQKEMEQALLKKMKYLNEDADLRKKLSRNMRQFFLPDAAGQIANILVRYLA
ncbi:MAG: UDP-N-acetylglucosamine--N-acetylmuramyl-(pentapeptide) pyrophosphoryl-undecaprenol N-acetylglucosamine transferase [Candidatus Peribacteraceae bacterium]